MRIWPRIPKRTASSLRRRPKAVYRTRPSGCKRSWTTCAAATSCPYNILLRFRVERVEEILATLQQEGLEPGVLSLAQTLFCYDKVAQTARAKEVLQRMIGLAGDNFFDDKAMAESVHNIMIAYHDAVGSAFSSNEKKKEDKLALLLRTRLVRRR